MQKVFVDPPGGWRHGFPKVYDPKTDGSLENWLVLSGYPIEGIELALQYSRMWSAE